MKVLFDTNVVLDSLLDREPFAQVASTLISKVEQGALAGYLCPTTITTIYYLAAKVRGTPSARKNVRQLLTLFEVAAVNRPVLEAELNAGFSDFGDAVLYEAACQVKVDAIVTRNTQDFRRARIPVYSPDEIARLLVVRDG